MTGKVRPLLRHQDKAVSEPERQSLFEVAYERLEHMIITCQLRPGASFAIGDLQELLNVGRTPTHQAVSRLAQDTLIVVHARQGLMIAPVNLARERTLLRLRRDVESFVIRLAVERAGPVHRNRILHIARLMRERGEALDIAGFNHLDRQIDQVITDAAGELFLQHTLRPLHTISRRVGWIYHSWMPGEDLLHGTIRGHLAILEAMAAGQAEAAVQAAGRLLDFVDSMFDVLEAGISPGLLDCRLSALDAA